jgi:hypothetical protein
MTLRGGIVSLLGEAVPQQRHGLAPLDADVIDPNCGSPQRASKHNGDDAKQHR